MVTCLSVLTRLEILVIGFESPRSRPDRKSRRPPPPTRTLLPVLTEFHFRGHEKYLEDLVARIDAPLLDNLRYILLRSTAIQHSGTHPVHPLHTKVQGTRRRTRDLNRWDISVTHPQTAGGTLSLKILDKFWNRF